MGLDVCVNPVTNRKLLKKEKGGVVMLNRFLVWIGWRLSKEEQDFLSRIHNPEEIVVGERGSLYRKKPTCQE